ncbi:MAG TPA: glycosyltransferase family 9 protein, partial [Chloroflexaceae bacterium]|nr:glycosyltransferase family 9 protein [Chloroflexaceae bacterium]
GARARWTGGRATPRSRPGGARLSLLASPAGAQAAALLPWVDEVLPFRAVWQDLGRLPFDPARELELVRALAERQFDAALVFTSFSQTPHTPAYACYLAGIPLRAGESKEFGGAVLTTAVPPAPDELHQVERNLCLVEAVGYNVWGRALCVAVPWEARASAADLLASVEIDPGQPFVVVHPGASAQARRYDPVAMGAVARLLDEQGLQVLVTGVERELPLIDPVLTAAPAARSMVGGVSLAEYAAVLERAELVICGNTLPLHLADALGTPVLGLYSGTDYESQWRPRNVPHTLLRRATPCHPCYLFECPIGQPCLDIAPDEVLEAALDLMAEPAGLRSLERGKRYVA